ncbi:hypothetical protein BH24ACT16_BH24ACT16_09240 [soil metagenome]
MRRFARSGVLAMLIAFSLTLAACGQTESGTDQESGGSPEPTSEETTGGMESTQGMEETTGSMGGMDMGSEEIARQMLEENGEYSDELFIDQMVPHHRGAVEEAEVALENTEHEELRSLAEDIIADQEAEIEQLRDIKEAEYGTREVAEEVSDEEMEMMGMMQDPEELANEDPFDRAFIDNMLPHHQSAIAMAQVALDKTENEEIRYIAQNIRDSQQREIEQMREWREEWYPES